jgi:hypothetical protein
MSPCYTTIKEKAKQKTGKVLQKTLNKLKGRPLAAFLSQK